MLLGKSDQRLFPTRIPAQLLRGKNSSVILGILSKFLNSGKKDIFVDREHLEFYPKCRNELNERRDFLKPCDKFRKSFYYKGIRISFYREFVLKRGFRRVSACFSPCISLLVLLTFLCFLDNGKYEKMEKTEV